jgi:hypothetical protein
LAASESSVNTLNTQVITGGTGTVLQRVIDVENQVITGGAGTVRQRVIDAETKNGQQDTSISALNTQVITGGAGTIASRVAAAETSILTLNNQVINGGAGTVRQRVIDIEAQVFSTATTTTILYRLNAVVNLANTLNTHVLVGGSGTLLTRMGTAESKNTAQDSSITNLRPKDGYEVVTVLAIPHTTSVYMSSGRRYSVIQNSYVMLDWSREIANLHTGQVCL